MQNFYLQLSNDHSKHISLQQKYVYSFLKNSFDHKL